MQSYFMLKIYNYKIKTNQKQPLQHKNLWTSDLGKTPGYRILRMCYTDSVL